MEELLSRRSRLQQQLLEYHTQVTASDDNNENTTSGDAGSLLESIAELQKKLHDVTMESSLKEFTIQRLQLNNTLVSTICPTRPGDNFDTETNKKKVLVELVEEQTKISSEITAILNDIKEKQHTAAGLEKQNLELHQRNRELMSMLQDNPQTQQAQPASLISLQKQVEKKRSNLMLFQHTFQNLLIASAVDWFADDDLRPLMLQLGEPIPGAERTT